MRLPPCVDPYTSALFWDSLACKGLAFPATYLAGITQYQGQQMGTNKLNT